jgi:RimJ/RimL family protein N-acetyltransferase
MQAFDNLPLRTSRLTLRPLRDGDEGALFAIYSDPKVMRYWSTPPWPNLDAARAMISRDIATMDKEYLRLGIELAHGSALVGTCALFDINATCRRAEVGYALASTAWGNGYMHEALTALLQYGFEGLNLNRVEADIDPRNDSSAKSLLRLGFSKEGDLRERWIVDGEVSDTALFGLLQREWMARS